MKKGFTLIELMGVILLLGVIGLIAFPSILNQMKKIDTNVNEANKKLVYVAADDYINDNKESYKSEFDCDINKSNNSNFECSDIINVKIEDLINDGYLSNSIDVKNYNYVEVSIDNGITYNHKLIIKN